MQMRRDSETIHSRIAELLHLRKQFVVATIAEVKGSCPQKPGARMLVHPDGSFEFTIGGGTFEAEVIRDALAANSQNNITHREYRLTKSDIGMYCQGLVRVMFEAYRPRPQLLIFGGGHVGQALSKIAGVTGLFSLAVIDDREEFADRAKHEAADRVILTDRHYIKDVPETDDETWIVILTRCHATDKMLAARYLNKPYAYIGLIGSEAKIRQLRHELLEEGVSAPLLDKLHAPIGLPIGGKDPSEVAVSILAELIQLKNQRSAPEEWTQWQISEQQS
jgi:xanthine dehydrogenase accessory factor